MIEKIYDQFFSVYEGPIAFKKPSAKALNDR